MHFLSTRGDAAKLYFVGLLAPLSEMFTLPGLQWTLIAFSTGTAPQCGDEDYFATDNLQGECSQSNYNAWWVVAVFFLYMEGMILVLWCCRLAASHYLHSTCAYVATLMLSTANTFRHVAHFEQPVPHDDMNVFEGSYGFSAFALGAMTILGYALLVFMLIKVCCTMNKKDEAEGRGVEGQNLCSCVLRPLYIGVIYMTILVGNIVRFALWLSASGWQVHLVNVVLSLDFLLHIVQLIFILKSRDAVMERYWDFMDLASARGGEVESDVEMGQRT